MDFSRELVMKFGDAYMTKVSEVLSNYFGGNFQNGHDTKTLDCITNLMISTYAIYNSSV